MVWGLGSRALRIPLCKFNVEAEIVVLHLHDESCLGPLLWLGTSGLWLGGWPGVAVLGFKVQGLGYKVLRHQKRIFICMAV